jgi:hypothetical protein
VIPLKAALPKTRGSLFGKNIQFNTYGIGPKYFVFELGAKPPTGMRSIPFYPSETFGSERKPFEFFYK